MLVAFGALVTLFVTTDLSVKLVVDNSHSAKPLIFKIAGTWGNHEGSMLLWVTIMAVAGAFVALIERRLEERTLIATLAGQAFISLGFYAFLLIASNTSHKNADAATREVVGPHVDAAPQPRDAGLVRRVVVGRVLEPHHLGRALLRRQEHVGRRALLRRTAARHRDEVLEVRELRLFYTKIAFT